MVITDIRIYPFSGGKPGAFVNVTFGRTEKDRDFVITGLKVIEGKKGLFLAMPSVKQKNSEEYKDTAFPLNANFRIYMNDMVIKKYEETLSGSGTTSTGSKSTDDLPF